MHSWAFSMVIGAYNIRLNTFREIIVPDDAFRSQPLDALRGSFGFPTGGPLAPKNGLLPGAPTGGPSLFAPVNTTSILNTSIYTLISRLAMEEICILGWYVDFF